MGERVWIGLVTIIVLIAGASALEQNALVHCGGQVFRDG